MDKIKEYFNMCIQKFKKTKNCKVETESAPPIVSKKSISCR